MPRPLTRRSGALAVLLLTLIIACAPPTGDTPPAPDPPTGGTPTASTCEGDPAWVTSPSLPAEIPGTGSICNFEQLIWQTMLYLVQPTPDPDVLELETYMPDYGIFVAAGEQPTPYGEHPPDPCTPPADVAGKAIGDAPFFFSDITNQAGIEQPLLDPGGELVWYGLSVNEAAYDMLVGCELYRSNCAGPLKPGNTGSVDIVDSYPTLAFPDGAIELKTAWKVLTAAEASSGLFYSLTGNIRPDGTACRQVTLGLVGVHVVVKTPSTPAMVWATFEHRNNAPDCSDLDAAPPLGGAWNFFDRATCENCTTNVYEPGHPTQVCRMHPQGDSSIGTFPEGQDCAEEPNQFACQPDVQAMLAESTAAIRDLNTSVQSLILDHADSSPIDRVWANYELVGNVWTRDGVTPPILQAQVGSLSAENTTMETYTQNGPSRRTNPYNCFSCHNQSSSVFGKNLPQVGLSHIFDQLAPDSGGCEDDQLPATCGPYHSS